MVKYLNGEVRKYFHFTDELMKDQPFSMDDAVELGNPLWKKPYII